MSKSFSFLLVGSVFVSISVASAQNVPRLYTNGASCSAIKSAIRNNSKIVLRYKKPGGLRITYDLFFKSPSGCTGHEDAVSASVPSSGGACAVKYQCVPRMDQDEESTPEPVVVINSVPPSDNDCDGCQPP